MAYIYNDEDNVAMNPETLDRIDQDGHNPTVYASYAEMREAEKDIPFAELPDNGCWNCLLYDGDRCTAYWNNNDPVYYFPDRDDKKPWEICEMWEKDDGAIWEDFFDG